MNEEDLLKEIKDRILNFLAKQIIDDAKHYQETFHPEKKWEALNHAEQLEHIDREIETSFAKLDLSDILGSGEEEF